MDQSNIERIDEHEILENFIVNNADLQKLEATISQFNIFEAIGMTYQEIRHSRFLAFLLDPSANHGLGDTFLKRVLAVTLSNSENDPSVSTSRKFDDKDFTNAFVQTEWRNIDISIVDDTLELAIVIENKIFSSEHSNQLVRYAETVESHYRNYEHLFIFLTPDGMSASYESYYSLSYEDIEKIVENILSEPAIDKEIAILMQHYITMLRRHIMSNSDTVELCQKIYREHRQALDLIFEHRPDLQTTVGEYLIEKLTTIPILISEEEIRKISRKSNIRFMPKKWQDMPKLDSGYTLVFDFNMENGLELVIVIGPGSIPIRQALLNAAIDHTPLFNPHRKTLNEKWNRVYKRPILNQGELSGGVFDDIKPKIDEFWSNFFAGDFHDICEVIENIDWQSIEYKS